ncbi:MAG: Type IIS restriction enzyme Eco57I [Dehalococcoidia bacterium]|nr:Type IIS restriction enzyme Eco57I [Bacillota bacterium]
MYFSNVFHEKGGFDVVIANPPYIDYRYIPRDTVKSLSNFYVYNPSARPNIYMFFIERSYQILKTNGVLTYINPNQFLSIDAGYTLRKMLINNTTIKFFCDVSYIKVFSEASTYSLVWSFLKRNEEDYTIRVNRCSDLNMLSATTFEISKSEITVDRELRVAIVENRELLSKVAYSKYRLGQLCKMVWGTSRSGYGKLKIKETQYLHLSEKRQRMYRPILQTSDIKRFYIDWQREFIPVSIYSENIKRVFEQEKLLIARVTKKLQSAMDTERRYVGKATIIFSSAMSLKMTISLLNSKLINYWYCTKFETTHMAGGYIRFDIPYLSQIPIPKSIIDDPSRQEPFVDLVNQILAITKEGEYLTNPTKQARVKKYEHQIDQMVYELYGLTEEEIKIVEGSAGR